MVCHLSVLPAASVSNTQYVGIDCLGTSSPWIHWLLGLRNTHLSNEHRSRSANAAVTWFSFDSEPDKT